MARRLLLLLVAAGLAGALDLLAKLLMVEFRPGAVAYHATPVPFVRLAILLPVALVLIPLLADARTAAAAGLVVGGSCANVLSLALWARGVPDFIPIFGGFANVADAEIALGTLLVAGCLLLRRGPRAAASSPTA